MEALKNKKPKTLFLLGAVTIAFSQILMHFTSLSDSILGLLMGAGIGFFIVAVIAKIKQKAS